MKQKGLWDRIVRHPSSWVSSTYFGQGYPYAVVHQLAEQGEPLTPERFRAVYRKLLEQYFGPRFTLDEQLCLECFRIPHFYRAFYVYKYATGLAAAGVDATDWSICQNRPVASRSAAGVGEAARSPRDLVGAAQLAKVRI